MTNFSEKFGSRLRRLSEQSGIGAAAIAESVGKSKSTVYQWLTGERLPRGIVTLTRLCELFDVSCDDLLKGILEE